MMMVLTVTVKLWRWCSYIQVCRFLLNISYVGTVIFPDIFVNLLFCYVASCNFWSVFVRIKKFVNKQAVLAINYFTWYSCFLRHKVFLINIRSLFLHVHVLLVNYLNLRPSIYRRTLLLSSILFFLVINAFLLPYFLEQQIVFSLHLLCHLQGDWEGKWLWKFLSLEKLSSCFEAFFLYRIVKILLGLCNS